MLALLLKFVIYAATWNAVYSQAAPKAFVDQFSGYVTIFGKAGNESSDYAQVVDANGSPFSVNAIATACGDDSRCHAAHSNGFLYSYDDDAASNFYVSNSSCSSGTNGRVRTIGCGGEAKFLECSGIYFSPTVLNSYNLPPFLCAKTCDSAPDCVAFDVKGSVCRTFKWKTWSGTGYLKLL